MLPAAISTSFAFMLPVATPPNTLAFSYGYLKVIDMVGDTHTYVKLKIFAIEYELSNWIMQLLFQLSICPVEIQVLISPANSRFAY